MELPLAKRSRASRARPRGIRVDRLKFLNSGSRKQEITGRIRRIGNYFRHRRGSGTNEAACGFMLCSSQGAAAWARAKRARHPQTSDRRHGWTPVVRWSAGQRRGCAESGHPLDENRVDCDRLLMHKAGLTVKFQSSWMDRHDRRTGHNVLDRQDRQRGVQLSEGREVVEDRFDRGVDQLIRLIAG